MHRNEDKGSMSSKEPSNFGAVEAVGELAVELV